MLLRIKGIKGIIASTLFYITPGSEGSAVHCSEPNSSDEIHSLLACRCTSSLILIRGDLSEECHVAFQRFRGYRVGKRIFKNKGEK